MIFCRNSHQFYYHYYYYFIVLFLVKFAKFYTHRPPFLFSFSYLVFTQFNFTVQSIIILAFP